MTEVFPAPKKPVKTVMGIGEGTIVILGFWPRKGGLEVDELLELWSYLVVCTTEKENMTCSTVVKIWVLLMLHKISDSTRGHQDILMKRYEGKIILCDRLGTNSGSTNSTSTLLSLEIRTLKMLQRTQLLTR